MALFKKKADPISDRAQALNAEIAALETQIKQLDLAMKHYETAIQEIPDREAESKKKAMYLAGRLSLYLHGLDKTSTNNLDTARKHLTTDPGRILREHRGHRCDR